jgi:hypothetical protein
MRKLSPSRAATFAVVALTIVTMAAAPAQASRHRGHHHHHRHHPSGGGGGGSPGSGPFHCTATPNAVARSTTNGISFTVSCTGMEQNQAVTVSAAGLQNLCTKVRAEGFRIPTGFTADKNGDLDVGVTAAACHTGGFNFELSEQSTPFKTVDVPVTIV